MANWGCNTLNIGPRIRLKVLIPALLDLGLSSIGQCSVCNLSNSSAPAVINLKNFHGIKVHGVYCSMACSLLITGDTACRNGSRVQNKKASSSQGIRYSVPLGGIAKVTG